MESIVLEQCPFCGGKDLTVRRLPTQVFCTVCGAEGPQGEMVHEAMLLWNQRANANIQQQVQADSITNSLT